MFMNPKTLVSRTRLPFLSFNRDRDLTAGDVQTARDYAAAFWKKLERYHPKDDGNAIGLPKPYLISSYQEGVEFDYDELFYWDSFFNMQGMLDEDHRELFMGILEDLAYEFERFKIIPNASRLFYVSRSQPPFLTSIIFNLYETYDPGKKWLEKYIKVAKQEYETVWMGVRKPNARQIHRGLSRYYDFNYLHDIAEAESGWDMTPRFNRKCMDYLPVDLNSLLYKYEMDFAKAARIFDDKREAAKWEQAAKARKHVMNELMWDKLRGLFYDYNYAKKKRGTVSSVATYFPMWAGLVSEKQAASLVKALRRFENKGGMATTDTLQLGQYVLGSMPTQWAYPNGWAPLHFIIVQGLERYGYHNDARRIALKWLKTNMTWFNSHGHFLEKYNVVSPNDPPAKGVYPAQNDFGWTIAIFERFCKDYIDKPS